MICEMTARNPDFERYCEETSGQAFGEIALDAKISLRRAFDAQGMNADIISVPIIDFYSLLIFSVVINSILTALFMDIHYLLSAVICDKFLDTFLTLCLPLCFDFDFSIGRRLFFSNAVTLNFA